MLDRQTLGEEHTGLHLPDSIDEVVGVQSKLVCLGLLEFQLNLLLYHVFKHSSSQWHNILQLEESNYLFESTTLLPHCLATHEELRGPGSIFILRLPARKAVSVSTYILHA